MTDGERFESLIPRLMRVILPASDADPCGHLPIGQIRLLRALETGERTTSEVGEELGLSASALSQMVHRMEEAGLVARRDHPDDRRQRTLMITPAAQALMLQRRALRSRHAEFALARLEPGERQTLIHLLAKIAGSSPIGPVSAAAETSDRSPY